MSSQDWNNVVLQSKKQKKKGAPGLGAGAAEKKYAAGSNAKGAPSNMAKLDADTESLSHNKVGLALGKAIQQARVKKGMKRNDLANSINEGARVVDGYENGKAILNEGILRKIERTLGTKLPRPGKK